MLVSYYKFVIINYIVLMIKGCYLLVDVVTQNGNHKLINKPSYRGLRF